MILHTIYALREKNAAKGTITLAALTPLDLIKKARTRQMRGIMTKAKVTTEKFNKLIQEGK